MCGEGMINKINDMSKKLDDVPKIIQQEFSRTLILCGIDPENPIAMQELVLWGKTSMEKEKQTSFRIRNTFADIMTKGLVFLVVLGFITFYTHSMVKYAIREEQKATIKIEKIDTKG